MHAEKTNQVACAPLFLGGSHAVKLADRQIFDLDFEKACKDVGRNWKKKKDVQKRGWVILVRLPTCSSSVDEW
jgi:hypothetical protein